jgi:uncharacterized membrane protein
MLPRHLLALIGVMNLGALGCDLPETVKPGDLALFVATVDTIRTNGKAISEDLQGVYSKLSSGSPLSRDDENVIRDFLRSVTTAGG